MLNLLNLSLSLISFRNFLSWSCTWSSVGWVVNFLRFRNSNRSFSWCNLLILVVRWPAHQLFFKQRLTVCIKWLKYFLSCGVRRFFEIISRLTFSLLRLWSICVVSRSCSYEIRSCSDRRNILDLFRILRGKFSNYSFFWICSASIRIFG